MASCAQSSWRVRSGDGEWFMALRQSQGIGSGGEGGLMPAGYSALCASFRAALYADLASSIVRVLAVW